MRAFLLLAAMVAAMTSEQATVAREIMKSLGVPPWSILVDAALSDQIAFAQQDKHIIYIDAKRFLNAPNTWANVVVHEAQHLKGSKV